MNPETAGRRQTTPLHAFRRPPPTMVWGATLHIRLGNGADPFALRLLEKSSYAQFLFSSTHIIGENGFRKPGNTEERY